MRRNARTRDERTDRAAPAIEVWLTDLALLDDTLLQYCTSLLDSEETLRLARFRHPDARLQYLASRALLRVMLSHYVAVPPTAWRFRRDAHGRPFVCTPAAGARLNFSLSHTRGLVACTVHDRGAVGLDVEHTGRRLDPLALARQCFSAVEIGELERTPPAGRESAFFRCWTLKEAYVKARGLGMSLPLDAFWFDADTATPAIHFCEDGFDNAGRWRFFCATPTAEHRLALALEHSPEKTVPRLCWMVPGTQPTTVASRVPGRPL